MLHFDEMEVSMRHNIGRWERLLRVILGGALVVAGWVYLAGFGMGTLPVVIISAGALLVVTGVLSFCPLNAAFNRNSCLQCRQGVSEEHTPA